MQKVIILTDLGRGDPDDKQSLIHYLWLCDNFETLGIIATHPGGQPGSIKEVIAQYRKDYKKLSAHSPAYPKPNSLDAVVRDGTRKEGVDFLISQVRKHGRKRNKVNVLVWGNIHTLADALRKKRSIQKKMRVYSIDGWNVQNPDPSHHRWISRSCPKLDWIQDASTGRGLWVKGIGNKGKLNNKAYVEWLKNNAGAMGKFYHKISAGVAYPGYPPSVSQFALKEGDSLSFLHLLYGDRNNPTKPSIAGQFVKLSGFRKRYSDSMKGSHKLGPYEGARTVKRNQILKKTRDKINMIYGS
jgi:hypothetical protein